MSDHGYGAYSHGCRCDICRKANADYMRDRRAAARALAQKHTRSATGARPTNGTARAPGAVRYVSATATHGTGAGYDFHGCRCFPCTDARMASDRQYLARKQRRSA